MTRQEKGFALAALVVAAAGPFIAALAYWYPRPTPAEVSPELAAVIKLLIKSGQGGPPQPKLTISPTTERNPIRPIPRGLPNSAVGGPPSIPVKFGLPGELIPEDQEEVILQNLKNVAGDVGNLSDVVCDQPTPIGSPKPSAIVCHANGKAYAFQFSYSGASD